MTRVPCWANVSSCGSCLRHIGINPSTRHPQRLVGRVPSLCSLMHCKPACGCLQCMFCCVIVHVRTGALTAVACLHVSKCYSAQTNVLSSNHASKEFLGFRLYPTRLNLVATTSSRGCVPHCNAHDIWRDQQCLGERTWNSHCALTHTVTTNG